MNRNFSFLLQIRKRKGRAFSIAKHTPLKKKRDVQLLSHHSQKRKNNFFIHHSAAHTKRTTEERHPQSITPFAAVAAAMRVSEADAIDVSKQHLNSLLQEITHVQSFKGKWSLIKAKCAHLQILLSDFSDFPLSKTNPLSLDLLLSISQSLNDGVVLSRVCQSITVPDGKLKTQNDLDSLLSKLDRHARESEILIKSGVLQDGVVLGSVSKKETTRAEIRSFLTRLQIGNAESKSLAMDSLIGMLQEDDKNVMIAVAQGIVPLLLRLLDSSSLEMKEKSIYAISRISTVESSKHVLIAEGLLLLNQLIRVLESGSGFAKEKACVALQSLSFSKDNARAIGSRGCISSLLEICQGGTPGSQAFAAGVLSNLALCEETKENFIEEKAVFVLIGLVSCGTVLAQETAIGCLSNLVKHEDDGNESLKLLFVKEGVLECLKNFWDCCPPVRSLEVGIELLGQLSSNHGVAEMIFCVGFVGRLVEVLNCGVLSARIAAARAVYELAVNAKIRREFGDCGCISPLIKMLDGKAVGEKEAAAKVLSTLMLCAANRRLFRKDDSGILSTVQLLDPLIHNLDKQYPVSILGSLVHSKKCRKQMIAAGAVLHLKKLVEMDVEGAKKLLDSLGRGKIWGVFSRP